VNPADLIAWTDDTDSDEDTLPDWQEFILGTNPYNQDTDGDGIGDAWEIAHGMNPVDATDADRDADGDGLTNREEQANGTDPYNASTGGSGIPDGWAIANGLNPLDPNLASGDPTGRGMTNYWKYLLGLNPNSTDTDGNGTADVDEDTDGDGIPNGWEIAYGLDPSNPHDADEDWDGDGISNDWEYRLGLNPWSPETYGYPDGVVDSDGDGIPDKWEIAHGLNPLDAADADLDPDFGGGSTADEFRAGTDFKSASSTPPRLEDQQEFSDGQTPAIFLIDVTGGDPMKTTLEVKPIPNLTKGEATPLLGAFIEWGMATPHVGAYIEYLPPAALVRFDAFEVTARQGSYESPPKRIWVRVEGVVAITPPGAFRQQRKDGFTLFPLNNDYDDHAESLDNRPPRDNADQTIGPNDDDIVPIDLAFNPDEISVTYATLALRLPANVRVFAEPTNWDGDRANLIALPDGRRDFDIDLNNSAFYSDEPGSEAGIPIFLRPFKPLVRLGHLRVHVEALSEFNGGDFTLTAREAILLAAVSGGSGTKPDEKTAKNTVRPPLEFIASDIYRGFDPGLDSAPWTITHYIPSLAAFDINSFKARHPAYMAKLDQFLEGKPTEVQCAIMNAVQYTELSGGTALTQFGASLANGTGPLKVKGPGVMGSPLTEFDKDKVAAVVISNTKSFVIEANQPSDGLAHSTAIEARGQHANGIERCESAGT
jgi:hypothetical protein